jgi:hypothetical protein
LPFDVSALILEMQQGPELEARIRHRELDPVVLCQPHGLIQVGMHVNIEDTPNLVVEKIVVSFSSGFIPRYCAEAYCFLNDGERHTSLFGYHDLSSRVSGFLPEIMEVRPLGHATFADDQDALPGLSERGTSLD